MRRANLTTILISSCLSITCGCSPLAPLANRSTAWPQFRGPAGQGHAVAKNLPDRWSETENIIWKTELPGKGWSSPVIEGERIWMTTAIETPATAEERAKQLEDIDNQQPLTIVGKLSLRAQCVDRTSGELLHDIELMEVRNPDPIHELNSFASPSPVIEDGKLYCHFGSNGTCCLDTSTRKVVWKRTDLRVDHANGAGSSPVLWEDVLIFHCDGVDRQFIVGLDKRTGKTRWQTTRSGKLDSDPQLRKAYGTPLLITVDGKPQLISPAADWVYSYDPASGKELWKLGYGMLGFSIVPRPVVGHGMIYMCTSFMQSKLIAIRYRHGDESTQPAIAWKFQQSVSQMPSPILVDDKIYFVYDNNGVVTCLDARSGDRTWKARLQKKGGNYSASPVFADGKIYFFSREGVTTVIRPGDKFEVIAENKIDGRFMASPAVVDSALYLRTDKAIYRIEKKS